MKSNTHDYKENGDGRRKEKKVNPPLKYHGGKHFLAKKIIALFPPRCKNPNKPDLSDPGYLHYVEPYAGGLAVLLANDPEGISECVCDLNKRLTQFWAVLQDREQFDLFVRRIQAVPFSKEEWEIACQAHEIPDGQLEPWEHAANFFIHCRISLAGRMDSFTGITKTRCRRGMNNEVSAWLTAVEGLPAVHERLKRVVILGPRDALEAIKSQDGPRTLFYLDPPYLSETRASPDVYQHEMTKVQHVDLLTVLGGIKGRFLLSGYHSDLYDSFASAHDWNCTEFKIDNKAAGGKEKRVMTECVWRNYE